MFKRLTILALLLAVFSPVFSEETAPSTNAPANPFDLGFVFGSQTINGSNYNVLKIQPDLDFGMFGFGLDLNLEFDINLNLRMTEYNTWQAWLSKITYVRVGKKGNFKELPVYVQLGGNKMFMLGNGFILSGYNNMLNYPAVKKVGLAFDMDFTYVGFETLVDNLFDFDILGGRLYVRPLKTTKIPLFENLEFGATVAADIDPQNPAPPADRPYEFTDTASGSNVTIWGLDVGLPVLDIGVVNMKAYLDFASIVGKGTGEVLGVAGSVLGLIPYRLEARLLQPGFLPNYFDVFYDTTRSIKYATLDSVTNLYFGLMFLSGFAYTKDNKTLAAALIQIEDKDLGSTNINAELAFSLVVDKELLFNTAAATFTWSRKNIINFSDIFSYEDVNSIMSLSVSYFISQNLSIDLLYTRTFQLDETGAVIPFTTTTINTRIEFF